MVGPGIRQPGPATSPGGSNESPLLACVEVGGSGIQTVVFHGGSPRLVDGLDVPPDAVVALAVPGLVADGRVVRSSTFGGVDVDPAEQLGIEATVTIVCNDAEAAAMGEWVLRGRRDDALVFVGLGTGVGGAVVADGRAVATNLFGHEPGHGSARCTCGELGCLETVAAGWALPDPVRPPELASAARAIARTLRAHPHARRGVVVVGGGFTRRHPEIVELIARQLPARTVVGSSAPPSSKSAAAYGLREMVVRDHTPIGSAVDLRVGPDVDWVATTAADVIEATAAQHPDLVLGVATGSTPLPTYAELARRRVDLSHTWIYLLDEYVGLDRNDPRTFRATIARVFHQELGVSPERIRAPDVWSDDLRAECHRYESEIIERGGITLQILGIGRNGHIGFNEPGTSFSRRTHVVTLDESTRHDNAPLFGSNDEVPRRGITQGVSTILRSRALLLLATGAHKQSAVGAALRGAVSESTPASAVRLHPAATVVVDAAAWGDR
jgi:glucosamine-6-phosphate deaminase